MKYARINNMPLLFHIYGMHTFACMHNVYSHMCCHADISLKRKQHVLSSTEEVTNPAYTNIADDQCKKPIEEPIGYYAEVIIPTTQVKMTPNPAYAVP